MELISQKLPKLKLVQLKLVNFWQSLSLPEKLYTLSFALLIIFQGDYGLAAMLTVIGLLMEFWPKFSRAWDSLAGKAVILLFYATITNFALVSSASMVNEVTGVPAAHFNYTHNFAILLVLPSWILGISVVALMIYQLFVPFYLFAILLAKPFGIKMVRFFSKSNHPFFSNSMRFMVCFTVVFQLLSFWQGEQKSIEEILNGIDPNVTEVEQKQADLAKQQALDTAVVETQEPETPETFSISFNNAAGESDELLIPIDKGYESVIRYLIAMFAYRLEADSYSRCSKPASTRAVELNDYEVLLISENKNAKYGYDFVVAVCNSPSNNLFKNR
ncbi:hypothetical protein [Pseudoalteromonas sp.]|uniref:hypothetical protein n=1 Tax=Pseudoalteromonas sp. TaxID=53249 RepID=UPI003568A977